MLSKGQLGNVLVVDDDPAMRRICTRMLESEGWGVTAAENGLLAIEGMGMEQRDVYDCVVSDVNMPELDGFGLIAEIRRRDDDIPVLLMTGDPSLDGAVRAIENGAVSYLAKPFDQEQLASAVARAARRHGLARMRRRAESTDVPSDLAQRFQTALDQSWMAFQPIFDEHEHRVYAYEALIRTEESTMKRPDVLIAAAERLGRVHDLGRVVRAAVAKAAPDVPEGVLLFVNVHGLELTDEELYSPTSPLAQISSRVILEITERVGIDEGAGAKHAAMLRKLGYRIAVDDLGAGYAALGALASLEPEIVKLDMSLIRNISRNQTKRRVVGAIATLVRELGGRVVAEGVETVEERDALVRVGIELLQGWLYGKPARTLELPR